MSRKRIQRQKDTKALPLFAIKHLNYHQAIWANILPTYETKVILLEVCVMLDLP